MLNRELIVTQLSRWAEAAEQYWYDIPGTGGRLGCYGTGYNTWGVQTNQKYVSAMAAVAAYGQDESIRHHARDRAIAALRFSLASHKSGDQTCTDGAKWGHTWISVLGVERMMHAIPLLDEWLDDEDRAAIRRMLVSECQWLYENHPVVGDPWNSSRKNVPESNLWNGAVQWRTAVMYPDHEDCEKWKQRAREYLVNSVSIAEDAETQPLHVGANFFPNFALDHHGYLNVGYMVICASNAAMLHFDLKQLQLARPYELDHHQQDLWQVIRRMIFPDGRLCRIGGDTRVRYAYCQEYLLPALLYAADHLGDHHAISLANEQLQLIEREQATNRDGSFYAGRLSYLIETSPYYYTRLESDRANVLAMALTYGRLVDDKVYDEVESIESFESSVAGDWCEPEHGAVLHRSEHRIASFAWRASGLTQGMCQPPDASDLAEWEQNLAGKIEFAHTPHWGSQPDKPMRRVVNHHIETFPGGFATVGCVIEGANVEIAEGWRGQDLASHHIAFVALPDGHTVVGMQLCVTGNLRTILRVTEGMGLNVPNDLYNDFSRTIYSGHGEMPLSSPPGDDQHIDIDSRWLNIDNRVGAIGLYGCDHFTISRTAHRTGGRFQSLYVDRVAWHHDPRTRAVDANSVVLDCAWAVGADITKEQTSEWAKLNSDSANTNQSESSLTRTVTIVGMDKQRYTITADFSVDRPAVKVSAV